MGHSNWGLVASLEWDQKGTNKTLAPIGLGLFCQLLTSPKLPLISLYIYIYIYIYKTEAFEASTIFHISTILKKKTHKPQKKKTLLNPKKYLNEKSE